MGTTSKKEYKRFPHQVIVKAPGLLAMMYKVKELAEELNMPEGTLRYWLKSGAPHHRDSRGQIWVNGEEFSAWVETHRIKEHKKVLNGNQAYCFRCKQVVEMVNPEIVPIKGALIHVRGVCGKCGCTINRGGRRGKP
jgi:hypothetical protein